MKVNAVKLTSRHRKKISALLLTVMLSELVLPLKALALTSGPSQPEFQGFTPLATTSLVDPFSGDFSYNIPLLDIEGYPLNLVYRATSNIEEEGSWVGYGWNLNVGTLNRMVRGLPDDMNGEEIKSFQNIRERQVQTTGVSFEPNISFNVGVSEGIGLSAGVQSHLGFTKDEDNYTGRAIGVSVGGGVYAGVQAGPFSAGASAGVTLAANSASGGSVTPYAGFNAGLTLNDYCSIGFGRSVNRTFSTISGWAQPNIVGTFNISNVTREIQKNFINSVSNEIPQVTIPYSYVSNGTSYRLDLGVELGIIENLGLDMGIGITATSATSTTKYNSSNVHRGYGYMYYENATGGDLLDFTRDKDGGINKSMSFLPPAMKTYDVFSSTAHGAASTFRADRNDFGTVRDPWVEFKNTDLANKTHQLTVKAHLALTCWLGVSIKYDNIQTSTEGHVSSGGAADDAVAYRSTKGKDPNLFFKVCGAPSPVDEAYIAQVGKYGFYRQDKSHTVKGISDQKRLIMAEPISVLTNKDITTMFPGGTVIPDSLPSYQKGTPLYEANINKYGRKDSSKIGAIMNTNQNGETYVYAIPVNNHIKNEVAFRANGFNGPAFSYNEREGLMSTGSAEPPLDGQNVQQRDYLYKNTLTPEYATSYLLNAVLSPDYVDVNNDGITDDDMGRFVKFNYTKTEDDYRWRVPYADQNDNVALLNQGVKVTKFDDMGSYVIGSKDLWYTHSIESKNRVAEFYLSDRADARDSRSNIMRNDHPHKIDAYDDDKGAFSRMQRLDSIKYYDKHDRYFNKGNAVPLTTIYFDYDYNISSGVPNSDAGGKLRLTKVRVRHGHEPIEFAETYNLGYSSSNPAYSIGAKDGWGNYYPNNRPHPLCEFPYIDQFGSADNDAITSAFHLTSIGLPSGGKINIEYEADDYAYVQDKRAMALTPVVSVGMTPNVLFTDAFGLYDGGRNPFLYIYVHRPKDKDSNYIDVGDYKNYLLNGSDLLYFSFNINIAGNAFSTFDQVKGYAQVETIGVCPNSAGQYLYIKVKPVNLTGTNVKPSPMVNTAINMARAYASDQLYFQEAERPDGHNQNHAARLKKAAHQVADAVFGRNSIAELMKDYQAAHKYIASKSYVKLAMSKPKIGGGSRVSEITFSDEWDQMTPGESPWSTGYRYAYEDATGSSSGVASYEPTLGGEENPLRTGASYKLSSNTSKYPPYDPVELLKEDPVGESFFPMGSVGYSRVVIESIHKDYARSARSKVVQEFYTAKDFPFVAKFGPRKISMSIDADYPNPGLRDILLSFLGVSNTSSSSANSFFIKQDFIVETNDMHGKQKASYKYRLLPKDNKEELISSTEYFYHADGNGGLRNEVDVIEYKAVAPEYEHCSPEIVAQFPQRNLSVGKRTLGVDIDVCTDSREATSSETRQMAKKGGGLKICIPPSITPKFNWIEATHKHTDYFRATTTTKIINKYGILKSVRNYEEGAETIVENKYYDAVTGAPVVQVVKDKYGDDVYATNIPAYWTKTDLEPAYSGYPLYATGQEVSPLISGTLSFSNVSAPQLGGNSFLQAFFTTQEDVFHAGDELFVKASLNSGPVNWYRLYVTDVQVQKADWGEPDPLSRRYGKGLTTGVNFKVYVAPHKITSGTIQSGHSLSSIQTVFKYRSGRKNMLGLSAGNFRSYGNSLILAEDDTLWVGSEECDLPSFLRPVIDAAANRYASVHSLEDGSLGYSSLNPVSTAVMNQPYVSATYTLIGDRVGLTASGTTITEQRRNGLLYNWYYWLPARYDSTGSFIPLKPMLHHWDDSIFTATVKANGNAVWSPASTVTRSLPSLGPVEEKNNLGIYNAIFVEPVSKKVKHTTANGRFGQTWVETFEDMRRVRKYNGETDQVFSPFQADMSTTSGLVPGYEVFERIQSPNNTNGVNGSFTLDSTLSHSGLYSMKTTGGTSVKITPQLRTGTSSYSNLFDFNLDVATDQKFTCEVWVKRSSGVIIAPQVTIGGGSPTSMTAVSNSIEGWTLYRLNINVSDNVAVTFNFPHSQNYDDLRVYPAASNVKGYVYHPFKSYLMAVLDENNYATYYEYNTRNQLVRLKKETEKGIITMTENIKNIKAN